MVGASIENILMVEGEMKEVSEDDMLEALKLAHEAIKDQCKLQHGTYHRSRKDNEA